MGLSRGMISPEMGECPKCFLPREPGAWHCDGCGFEFSQDIEGVRAALQAEVRASRTGLWVALGVAVAVIAGLVYLVTIGFIYISVGLLVVAIGGVGHAVHRRSVAREHLYTFTRRHPAVPQDALAK